MEPNQNENIPQATQNQKSKLGWKIAIGVPLTIIAFLLLLTLLKKDDLSSLKFSGIFGIYESKFTKQLEEEKQIILNIDSIIENSDLDEAIKKALYAQRDSLVKLQREKEDLIAMINRLGENPSEEDKRKADEILNNYMGSSDTRRKNIFSSIEDTKKKISDGNITIPKKKYDELVAGNKPRPSYEDEYNEQLNINDQLRRLNKEKDSLLVESNKLLQMLRDSSGKDQKYIDSIMDVNAQLQGRISSIEKDYNNLAALVQPFKYKFELLSKYKYNKKAEKFEIKRSESVRFSVALEAKNGDEKKHSYSADSFYVSITSNKQFSTSTKQQIPIILVGSKNYTLAPEGKLDVGVYTITFTYRRCIDKSKSEFGQAQDLQSFTVEIKE